MCVGYVGGRRWSSAGYSGELGVSALARCDGVMIFEIWKRGIRQPTDTLAIKLPTVEVAASGLPAAAPQVAQEPKQRNCARDDQTEAPDPHESIRNPADKGQGSGQG